MSLNLPENEAELLYRINHNVPAQVRLRHAELAEKLYEETLTPAERPRRTWPESKPTANGL